MRTEEIMELIRCFDASGLERMKLSDGDFRMELNRNSCPASADTPESGVSERKTEKKPEPVKPAEENTKAEQKSAERVSVPEEGLQDLTAPLVGTFYAASAPDQPAYVKVGDQVKKGDILCLIEAMKMMNEIKAPCDCVIREITAENGSLVEYGKTMMRYLPC